MTWSVLFTTFPQLFILHSLKEGRFSIPLLLFEDAKTWFSILYTPKHFTHIHRFTFGVLQSYTTNLNIYILQRRLNLHAWTQKQTTNVHNMRDVCNFPHTNPNLQKCTFVNAEGVGNQKSRIFASFLTRVQFSPFDAILRGFKMAQGADFWQNNHKNLCRTKST